ncbi:electron transport complex subunit E [Halomonas denitrificans]|nr:electron transport complex subunit E [Halomonas denitrificans]
MAGRSTARSAASANRRAIWHQGLWSANPGLVQLLGLCPLLAVTSTAVNGLGLGLATLFVLAASNVAVSSIRTRLAPELRIPVFVLIIATLVTVVDRVLAAWFHDLSRTLGIFIPLIVTNCTLLARAEAFASRRPVLDSLHDGLAQGTGFLAVLVVLGSLRELLGQGTLGAGAGLLLGDWAAGLELRVFPERFGLLLAMLPPGAFIGLGLLVALRQHIQRRAEDGRSVGMAASTGTAGTDPAETPPEAPRH